MMFSSLEGGADLAQLPQYYVPYSLTRNAVVDKSQPLETLKQFNTANVDGYN